MMDLQVWWNDLEVGMLNPSPMGGLRFQYVDRWLERPEARPLSRSLPLQAKPQAEASATAFFAGLLPEEQIRQRVAASLGLSEGNDFALLQALGGDCAGAIRILEPGKESAIPEKPLYLDDRELAKRLRDLPRRPLLAGESGVRLSLAGAQTKLAVRREPEGWSLSNAHWPSTHILKPEPEAYPGLVSVEAFCLNASALAGIPTVKVEQLDFEGLPVLCIKRYDRLVQDSGEVSRNHQEDFCQSLGLPPHRKYQQEGGPSAKDTVECIRSWSTTPVLDLRQFVDQFIFNVLIGNADAHGKNFSWIYSNHTRRLAPAYDLVSTTLWPELSSRLAMRAGRAKYVEEVTRDHLKQFAKDTGLSAPMVRERTKSMCATFEQHLPRLLDTFPKLLPDHRVELETGIRRRSKKILT